MKGQYKIIAAQLFAPPSKRHKKTLHQVLLAELKKTKHQVISTKTKGEITIIEYGPMAGREK